MFAASTQCKHWMFSSEEELNKLRDSANTRHIQIYGKNIDEAAKYEFFLTPEEEKIMVKRYELHLRDFCKRFQPTMPRCVVGTAFHYFKRFYINNSVMNYHPKEIIAGLKYCAQCFPMHLKAWKHFCAWKHCAYKVTCIYLACKVEEFNVSIQQFVANIKGDREKATDIILNNELLLMEQLNFHLSIHNPFRPVEGLLIDIKTRGSLHDPERLRPGTEHFLERALLTDAILLYSPSQVALAAVLHAASKLQENLDSYVTDTLFGEDGRGKLEDLIDAVRGIRSMVKLADSVLDRNQQKILDKKLEKCRNPENNPDSEIYKKKMLAMLNEDDDLYGAISEQNYSMDNSALNMSIATSPQVA